MRIALVWAFIVGTSTLGFSQPAGQMAPVSPDNQTYAIPAGSKDQIVMIMTRDLQPGQSVSPHIHHGVEMTEVISGSLEVFRAGQKPQIVNAGGSFIVARELPHDARAIGKVPVHLAVTLVIDKASPPRTPVDMVLIPK